jgi:hypothetical protein
MYQLYIECILRLYGRKVWGATVESSSVVFVTTSLVFVLPEMVLVVLRALYSLVKIVLVASGTSCYVSVVYRVHSTFVLTDI